MGLSSNNFYNAVSKFNNRKKAGSRMSISNTTYENKKDGSPSIQKEVISLKTAVMERLDHNTAKSKLDSTMEHGFGLGLVTSVETKSRQMSRSQFRMNPTESLFDASTQQQQLTQDSIRGHQTISPSMRNAG